MTNDILTSDTSPIKLGCTTFSALAIYGHTQGHCHAESDAYLISSNDHQE